jgi:hypothetical protein
MSLKAISEEIRGLLTEGPMPYKRSPRDSVACKCPHHKENLLPSAGYVVNGKTPLCPDCFEAGHGGPYGSKRTIL